MIAAKTTKGVSELYLADLLAAFAGVRAEEILRLPFAEFKLCAHLLQARSERFNLLLLARGSRLVFCNGRV